jgi:hypothetical protein
LDAAARHIVHITTVIQVQQTHSTVAVRKHGVIVVAVRHIVALLNGRTRLPIRGRKQKGFGRTVNCIIFKPRIVHIGIATTATSAAAAPGQGRSCCRQRDRHATCGAEGRRHWHGNQSGRCRRRNDLIIEGIHRCGCLQTNRNGDLISRTCPLRLARTDLCIVFRATFFLRPRASSRNPNDFRNSSMRSSI